MRDPIRKALTRKLCFPSGEVEVPPSEKLVYAVYFSIGLVFLLTLLEIAYMLVFHSWNGEIFTVISGLVGNITGIFLSQKG